MIKRFNGDSPIYMFYIYVMRLYVKNDMEFKYFVTQWFVMTLFYGHFDILYYW